MMMHAAAIIVVCLSHTFIIGGLAAAAGQHIEPFAGARVSFQDAGPPIAGGPQHVSLAAGRAARTESFTERVKKAKTVHGGNNAGNGRRLQTCTSFDDNPRDPGTNVQLEDEPWRGDRQTCKLLVEYYDLGDIVCSGSLVGPFHLITARSCTFNPCSADKSPAIRVACGYGYHPDADEYAHFGTAFVADCLFNQAHDTAATCVDDQPLVGEGRKYDIQICRLDRRIGDRHGWFDATADTLSEVEVRGYPGVSMQPWYLNAFWKRFYRKESIDSSTDFVYTLKDAWVFAGEEGSPYLSTDTYSTTGTFVSAVHSGGPTGCEANGTRISNDFLEDIKAVRGLDSTSSETAWPSPSPEQYCQLVNYPANLFGSVDRSYIGVAPSGTAPEVLIEKSLSIESGSDFQVRVSLFNVGTKASSNVQIQIYASTNDIISNADTLLTATSYPPAANYTITPYIIEVQASWGTGSRTIGAIWSTDDCFENDGDKAIIGTVAAGASLPTPSPVNPPTPNPVNPPTPNPVNLPTAGPVNLPTASPLNLPTVRPVSLPTPAPAASPTANPTNPPTPNPLEQKPITGKTIPPALPPAPKTVDPPTSNPVPDATDSPVAETEEGCLLRLIGICTCFSERTEVEVLGAGTTLMKDLKVGDKVLTDEGYSAVYSFGHKVMKGKTSYLQVLTDSMDMKHPLEISLEHLIFKHVEDSKATNVVPAGDLKVGDHLITENGLPTKIVSISTVVHEGAYSPLTTKGKLLVNGVLASSYVTRSWVKESVSGDTLHSFQHGSVVPYRFFCLLFGCQNELYHEETGFSPWVQFWYSVEQWQLQLSKNCRLAFFSFLATPAILATLLGKLLVLPTYLVMVHMAAAVLGYVVWNKAKKRNAKIFMHNNNEMKSKDKVS